jgi:hypothetical protein
MDQAQPRKSRRRLRSPVQAAPTRAGVEGTVTAEQKVTSRTLTGTWSNQALPCPTSESFCFVVELVQQGSALNGQWTVYYRGQTSGNLVNLSITAPNHVTFMQDAECRRVFTGTVSSDMNTITGSTNSLNFACPPENNLVLRRL